MLPIIFGAAVIIIGFIIFHKNEDKAYQAKKHSQEVDKLNRLRSNSKMNKFYDKAKEVYSLLISRYETSHFDYPLHIVEDLASSLLIKGEVNTNTRISLQIFLNASDDKIIVKLKTMNNKKVSKEKSFYHEYTLSEEPSKIFYAISNFINSNSF